MRPAFRPALVTGLLGLLFMQHAAAQVYQCLDASGKKVFSQLPCASPAAKDEKLIMRAPGFVAPVAPAAPVAGTPPPKDWAAENAAANARAAAADASAGGSRQTAAVGGLRKGGTAPTPAPTDKQIIASCEASHGARCSSAGEIAQRRMEQRELTPAERQQQQSAVAARRQREREEAFNRSMNR
ncbi:protein of unknown function [Polaromonas sp. YR568]|uniref:DUF4124 domain-containing protein n=1 Tax=Polaromonas sp. YR568 TaxID=1855301 RepID=UPI0008E05067|nr:DUF4124 domain-containing protein [Polaromonas sp. YR568]SFU55260.1 protein of unknown function [Polaromonas sp. YR568]